MGMKPDGNSGMISLEEKGFIDQSEWQRILSQQAGEPAPVVDRPARDAAASSTGRVGPWVLSILLHGALVSLALLWVWREKPQQTRQPVIPTAQLSALAGGPAIAPDHQLTEALPKLDIEALMEPTFESLPGLDGDPSAMLLNTASLLAPPAVASTTPQPTTTSPARVNPFTGLMPHALQPVAQFFGVAGNAQSVVYVVDVSGSLIDTLPYVLTELRRSILRLAEEQRFTVLFFQGRDLLEIPPTGLRQATAINQQRAVQWIDPDAGHLFAKGQSNPLPALQKALGYEPDIVFLLTDNLAAQQTGTQTDDALLDQIAKANTGHAAIHTIQFLYRDTPGNSDNPSDIPLLKRLAQQQGGQYTFVDAKDLKAP